MSFLKKSDIEDLYFEKSNFKENHYILDVTEEHHKKIYNKILKRWNEQIDLTLSFLNNIEKYQFKFYGKELLSINENFRMDIKNNTDSWRTKKGNKYHAFKIIFNNFYSYSMNYEDIVSIEKENAQSKYEYKAQAILNIVNLGSIFGRLKDIDKLSKLNDCFLILYNVKLRKNEILKGLSTEQKDKAMEVFENYSFSIDEKKNDIIFKEIQDLLSITMDLSIKEKPNKQQKNNKKVK